MFVYNYCPLTFMSSSGGNITPDKCVSAVSHQPPLFFVDPKWATAWFAEVRPNNPAPSTCRILRTGSLIFATCNVDSLFRVCHVLHGRRSTRAMYRLGASEMAVKNKIKPAGLCFFVLTLRSSAICIFSAAGLPARKIRSFF